MSGPTAPVVRNAGVDCLRGLAILLVIVHHLALPFRLPLGPSLLGGWWPERLLNAISFGGYKAVFMFFAISGFLITTRILERDGDLGRVNLRRFYAARAWRILPPLAVVLTVLTVLAWLEVPGFAPDATQSVGGLVGSALTFTFNWYEGRTGWAPAGWDVLWSLSIEELFYMGFPLMCLWLPRRVLIGILAIWALALIPLRDLVPASDEVWWEKAYLPGMAAIAWGVLAALLAARWRPTPGQARAMAAAGALGILLGLVWGDVLGSLMRGAGLYGVCIGTCLMLLAFHAYAPVQRRGLHWLARMGALSYELYLCHMFVVLAAVALYRWQLGDSQSWNFTVYVPVLFGSYGLAVLLQKATARRKRNPTQ